ncbi:MAG: M15 family metallopeptidase [Vulcanimicrobiota bacterium]
MKQILCILALAGLAWSQPAPNPEGAARLVELTRVVPDIRLEVRYATKNNFMKKVLYPQPRIFVRREVGEALGRVQKRLSQRGLSLLVFDGYRPWRITKKMWDDTPPENHKFVADPAKGSKHNRGGAVDLTLMDVKSGKALEMTSAYDEFSPRAAYNYPGGSQRSHQNRDLLRTVMEAEGFQVLPHEWWHFDYKGWKDFPLLDYSFDELDALEK